VLKVLTGGMLLCAARGEETKGRNIEWPMAVMSIRAFTSSVSKLYVETLVCRMFPTPFDVSFPLPHPASLPQLDIRPSSCMRSLVRLAGSQCVARQDSPTTYRRVAVRSQKWRSDGPQK